MDAALPPDEVLQRQILEIEAEFDALLVRINCSKGAYLAHPGLVWYDSRVIEAARRRDERIEEIEAAYYATLEGIE